MKIYSFPKKIVEYVIFNIRWLLIPFLIKLIWNIVFLLYIFFVKNGLPNEPLISTLEALDIVMVAALIEMVITGVYNSHIDREHGYPNKNITSGVLKIKMGTSLVGVSSIHLLKLFVEEKMASDPNWDELWKKVIIHMAFILGAIALAWIDRIHISSESIEIANEEKEHEAEEKRKHKNQYNEENHHVAGSNNYAPDLTKL